MKNLFTFFSLFMFAVLFSQPTTSAPTPPARSASNVFSIYSNAYTNQANVVFGAFSVGTQDIADITVNGDNVKKITFVQPDPQFLLVDWGTIVDASSFTNFHMDFWIDTTLSTGLVFNPKWSNHVGNSGETSFFIKTIPVSTLGSWVSIDIPISSFEGDTTQKRDALRQFILTAVGADNGSRTFYVDNIYLYKDASVAGTDATLSDLKIDGTTVSGFSPLTTTYSYGVPGGTTAVPQITATTKSDATATIVSTTQATAIPGTATVVVKSGDGTITKTYTVNYYYNSPMGPAPAPTPAAANVISIFSDAYTNVAGTDFNPNWSQATQVSTVQLSGNNTLKYVNLGYQGTQLASPVNVSAMTYLHIDYWTTNSTDLKVFLINSAAVTGGPAVQKEFALTVPTSGWKSVDIPLTNFSAKSALGVDLSKIDQMMFTGNGTIYLDNIYFSTELMGVNDVAKNSLKIYPNPVAQGDLVTISAKVKSVEVYNLNGQKVKTSTESNLSTQGLTKGVYIIKVTSGDDKTLTSKLIVR